MVSSAGRRGYRHLADAFWAEAESFGLPLGTPPVSGPAICEARRKIKPEHLKALIQQTAATFDERFGSALRWRGRRVFAVDGTKINLQRGDDLASHFGVPPGASCPQMLVSTLFDVISKVPIDVVVGRWASSERLHLIELLKHLRPGDLLVLDRGYPSFDLLCQLKATGIDFIMRTQATTGFAAVRDFVRRNGDDENILITRPKNGSKAIRKDIEVRTINGQGPLGVKTVLLTSLPRKQFSRATIGQAYKLRWEIEEFYKLVKNDYLGQGQFHSKTPVGIEQEVHAVALFVAITRYLMGAAAEEHHEPYESLSPKSGILGLADNIVRLILGADARSAPEVLGQILRRIIRTKDPKRPGRLCPRRSYLPTRKWGPHGRYGG